MKFSVVDAAQDSEQRLVMTVVAAPFETFAAAKAAAISILTERFKQSQRSATLHVIGHAGHVTSGVPMIHAVDSWDQGETMGDAPPGRR